MLFDISLDSSVILFPCSFQTVRDCAIINQRPLASAKMPCQLGITKSTIHDFDITAPRHAIVLVNRILCAATASYMTMTFVKPANMVNPAHRKTPFMSCIHMKVLPGRTPRQYHLFILRPIVEAVN